jgi:hypothetical protein
MSECDDGNEFMGVLRMVVNLRLRGFSSATQRMYLGCAQRFAATNHQAPTALGEADVRRFSTTSW